MEISTNQQLPGRGFFQKKLAAFVLGKNWKETLVFDCGLCCIFPNEPVKVGLAGAQATIDAVYLVRKPSASPGPPMIPMHPLGWCCYPDGHSSW